MPQPTKLNIGFSSFKNGLASSMLNQSANPYWDLPLPPLAPDTRPNSVHSFWAVLGWYHFTAGGNTLTFVFPFSNPVVDVNNGGLVIETTMIGLLFCSEGTSAVTRNFVDRFMARHASRPLLLGRQMLITPQVRISCFGDLRNALDHYTTINLRQVSQSHANMWRSGNRREIFDVLDSFDILDPENFIIQPKICRYSNVDERDSLFEFGETTSRFYRRGTSAYFDPWPRTGSSEVTYHHVLTPFPAACALEASTWQRARPHYQEPYGLKQYLPKGEPVYSEARFASRVTRAPRDILALKPAEPPSLSRYDTPTATYVRTNIQDIKFRLEQRLWQDTAVGRLVRGGDLDPRGIAGSEPLAEVLEDNDKAMRTCILIKDPRPELAGNPT